jgi:hypothetical protein
LNKQDEEMEGPTMKARLLGVVALLFDYFRKICTVAHDQFLSLSRRRLLVSITAGVLAALFLFWFVDKVIYYFLVRSYIDQVADVLDLNKHLINALVLLSFLAVVFFANLIWSFSKQKRRIGIAGIAALLVAHSLVLWFGTRDKFFDQAGTAVKCYVVTRDGTVTYGNRHGIDQATGRQCRPVTPEVVERLEEYRKGRLPQRVADTDPTFFSPRSGEPIVWYYLSKQKGIEIFDLMGFHPETGAELIPITKEIVETWREQPKQRCMPKRVDPEKFPFFDPRTREPKVWYSRDKDGNYEFYDCPGFHTGTGQELLVISQEIADEVLGKSARRAPNPVDITTFVIFDPNTGAARAWYWRGENINYEFFDGPGFHPRNGEPLKLFTKEAMQNWDREIKEEKVRLDRENKKRADEEEKRKDDLAKKEAADKKARDDERARLTQAAGLCDDLAANPSDSNRLGEGVPFDNLKARAKEAVSNCEIAISQNPAQLRFKYQLARALHWTDRKRAFDILQELVRQRYPAAFDNLGWLYLTEKKDPSGAITLFKAGAQAGDSDSMLSLAEMIDRNHLTVANPAQEKLALYQRAAQLGNKTAITAYQVELAKVQNEEQRRMQELQQQRMMLQMFGTVLRNIH